MEVWGEKINRTPDYGHTRITPNNPIDSSSGGWEIDSSRRDERNWGGYGDLGRDRSRR